MGLTQSIHRTQLVQKPRIPCGPIILTMKNEILKNQNNSNETLPKWIENNLLDPIQAVIKKSA